MKSVRYCSVREGGSKVYYSKPSVECLVHYLEFGIMWILMTNTALEDASFYKTKHKYIYL